MNKIRKIFLLIRVMLKSNSGMGITSDTHSPLKKNLIRVLFALCFLPITGYMVFLVNSVYKTLKPMGLETLSVYGIIVAVMIFVFMFGLIYSTGTFYFTKDIENYLPLPLSQGEIVMSKFITALIYEYITLSIMYFPMIITYGVNAERGLYYYFISIILFVFLPLIPFSCVCIIVMIVMRLTNIGKRKDLLVIVSSVLMLAVLLGINWFITGIASDFSQKLVSIVSSNEGTIDSIFQHLYIANSLVSTNIVSSLLNGVLFILISLFFLLIFYIIGNKIYFKGVLGLSEVNNKRVALSISDLKRKTTGRTAVFSYILKELRTLVRVPIFFINCIFSNVIILVVLMIPIVFGVSGGSDMDAIIGLLMGSDKTLGFIMVLGIIVMITSINGIAVTAISREGEGLFTMKYIPMSYKNQLTGKLLSAFVVGEFFAILTLILLCFILKFSIFEFLVLLLSSTMICLLSSFIGLVLDLHFPKLNWESEQKLIKQNLMVLANPLLTAIAAGAPILLFFYLGLHHIIIITIFLLYIVILNFILMKHMISYGVKKLHELY